MKKRREKRQKIRIWRNGKTKEAEWFLDPNQPVIDVDFWVGYPTAEPDVGVQMNYPGEGVEKKPS